MSSQDNRQSTTAEDILVTLDQFGTSSNTSATTATTESDSATCAKTVTEDSSLQDAVVNNGENDVEVSEADSNESASLQASISSSFSSEWHRLFDDPNYFKQLTDLAIEGGLRSCRFRSICWRLYLEVMPENKDEWLYKTYEWRKQYAELKNKFITTPSHEEPEADLHLHNPLSQAEESPWNRFFLDNELKMTITTDVVRTFPELEFFQTGNIQPMMINILFCYSRLHNTPYKQGMHELLAPLIFVLHCDQQAFLHACELESLDDLVKDLLNPEYIEHDAFAMFCQVMETVEPWYISKEKWEKNSNQEVVKKEPFTRSTDSQTTNIIVTKLTRLQECILKKFDNELYLHLERLEIYPQIYGIRWTRLLFGREFPMQDLLVVWDAIFSDGLVFGLVDYIFVAMLLYIRDILLSNDYAGVLGILMKYPPVGDVQNMIDKAIYLRDPSKPRPPSYTYNHRGPHPAHKKGKDMKVTASQLAEKIRTSTVSGFANLTRKMGSKTTESSRSTQLSTTNSGSSRNNKKPGKASNGSMTLLTEKSDSTAELNQFTKSPVHQSVQKSETVANQTTFKDVSSKEGSSSDMSRSVSDNSPTPPVSPTHTRKKGKTNKITPQERLLQLQVALLQGNLNDNQAMSQYCATKMDIHIEKLQSELLRQHVENEDELLLALAGLKQVRDILKGTLKFSYNLLEADDISIAENHYRRFSNEPLDILKRNSVSTIVQSEQNNKTEKANNEIVNSGTVNSDAEVLNTKQCTKDENETEAISSDQNKMEAAESCNTNSETVSENVNEPNGLF